jgi:multidrug efflux pump subunit AcrA (membrane-fusion protein)
MLGFTAAALLLAGCHQPSASKVTHQLPLPSVSLSHPHIETRAVYTEFHGVSRYLQSVHFSSQTTGVVSRVFVHPGDEIRKGQPLLTVKPVEISALEKSGTLTQQMRDSRDTVFSNQTVLVNQVAVQEGDYVQPGTLLASAFKKSSLAIIAYVPFSQAALIGKNKKCTLEIPGRKTIATRFGRKLFLADSTMQTQPYVVAVPSHMMLAANMNVRVRYQVKEIRNGLFIPRPALLSNEEETAFWVMKVVHNTAVKVPVTVGWQGKQYVQILSGKLNEKDQVITQGAYGLPDKAQVQINQK